MAKTLTYFWADSRLRRSKNPSLLCETEHLVETALRPQRSVIPLWPNAMADSHDAYQ